MIARTLTGAPLTPAVNVDPVDIPAGLAFAAGFGYTTPEHKMVADYALRRWSRGEEDGAVASFLSGGFSLTDAYAILAHAITAALKAAG